MADVPEVTKRNKIEAHVSQLTKNVLQNSLLKSSAPVVQQPEKVDQERSNLDLPSLPDTSPDECSTSAPLDMESLIDNCDLKSEEITSLMAEKVPSSDSEDNYGPGTSLPFEDVQLSSAEIVQNLADELMGKDRYKGFMRSWWADGGAMTFCREPLIPPEDESDIEELGNENENVKSEEKVSNEKGEPFVDDLINLKESQERILESSPNQTVVANASLLDIENESEHNQATALVKSHLDIEAETNQTSKKNKSLLSMGNESVRNQAAETKKSLLDIEIERALNQADLVKKSLLGTEIETTAAQTAESNNFLNTEIKTIANHTESNKIGLLDTEVDQAAMGKKSLLYTEIETAVDQAAMEKKSLLNTEIETASNQTEIGNKSLLDNEIETSSSQTEMRKESLLDTEIEISVNQTDLAKKILLDTEVETEMGKKTLLDTEIETPANHTAIEKNSFLDNGLKTVANLTDLAKKSLLYTEVETKVAKNSFLDTEIGETATHTTVPNNTEVETAVNEKDLAKKNILVTEVETEVAKNSFVDTEIKTVANETAVANNTEVETAVNQTDVAKKSLLDTKNETEEVKNSPRDTETETALSEPAVTKKSILDVEIEETLQEEKQISNSETESCARVCIARIEGVLSDNLKEAKKTDQVKADTNIDVENESFLETLEEDFRVDAEENSMGRQLHLDYEIGFPQKNIPASLRVIKDASFKRNLKRIFVCEASFNELSDDEELKKGGDEMIQSDKADEESHEKFKETDSYEHVDVISIEKPSSISNVEEQSRDIVNVTAPEVEPQKSAEPNITHDCPTDQNTARETMEDDTSEKSAENKADAVRDQKSEVIKSILKKRVTFSETRGDPGMEHMTLHQDDLPKIEETRLEMDTSLRFLTETYPSHEDEELLSESLNVTLEPSALPWPRMESPRTAGSHEKLKTHEGDENQPVSPLQSPERSDNKNTANKSGNKLSKLLKTVKKKIWN